MDNTLKQEFDSIVSLSLSATADNISNIKAYLLEHPNEVDMFHYLLIFELSEEIKIFNIEAMLKNVPDRYKFIYRFMSFDMFTKLFNNQTIENIFTFFKDYDDLNYQIVKYICDNRTNQKIPLKFFKVLAECDAQYFIENISCDELLNFCTFYMNAIFVPRNNRSVSLLRFYNLGYCYTYNL